VADRRLTGILLVGGPSRRFGSPKALARLGGETLAERAWRLLGEVSEERIAVGKAAAGLPLPFPLLEDGTTTQAPLAGLVAGLRAATTELAVVVPVDCPLVRAEDLLRLADACRDAAVPQTGPLPGAYRRSALAALEPALREGRLSLKEAISSLAVATVELPPERLANVNSPADLTAVAELEAGPAGPV
jgi:molybdopterin-guanine dinucleotide biosynthesis protein A